MIPADRLKRALGQFVKTVMARVDYLALYQCKVVSQNSDGSLELQPLAPTKLASFSHVPIRYGLPGATITVNAGAQVLLGWFNGDPAMPYAALWAPGPSSGSDLNSLNIANGTQGAARNNDSCQVSLTLLELASFTFTAPPGGGPCVVAGATQTLTGNITAGSSVVKIGG